MLSGFLWTRDFASQEVGLLSWDSQSLIHVQEDTWMQHCSRHSRRSPDHSRWFDFRFHQLAKSARQTKASLLAHALFRREELFKDFTIAASKSYGEALMRDTPRFRNLSNSTA